VPATKTFTNQVLAFCTSPIASRGVTRATLGGAGPDGGDAVRGRRTRGRPSPARSRLGRPVLPGYGATYPIALEGALKLKEITYAHCEGMLSTEFKHGPLSAVTDGFPILFVAGRPTSRSSSAGSTRSGSAGAPITIGQEDPGSARQRRRPGRRPGVGPAGRGAPQRAAAQLLAYRMSVLRSSTRTSRATCRDAHGGTDGPTRGPARDRRDRSDQGILPGPWIDASRPCCSCSRPGCLRPAGRCGGPRDPVHGRLGRPGDGSPRSRPWTGARPNPSPRELPWHRWPPPPPAPPRSHRARGGGLPYARRHAGPERFAVNLARAADFVPQYTFEWCVGASLQMARSIITGKRNETRRPSARCGSSPGPHRSAARTAAPIRRLDGGASTTWARAVPAGQPADVRGRRRRRRACHRREPPGRWASSCGPADTPG